MQSIKTNQLTSVPLARRRRVLNAIWSSGCILLLAGMYLPLLVVMLFSLNSSKFGTIWTGFTLDWYRNLLENEAIQSACLVSLSLAVISTCISTVLGTMLGLALSRSRFRMKAGVEFLLMIPVVVSDIVMAIALVSFFAFIRSMTGMFQLGLSAMVVAHVTFQLPFVALIVRSRMANLPASIEEAALDLGATPWQALRAVTLPLAIPGIAAGALLAFTLSLDDFIMSFFTSGPGSTTLPVLIYSSVKRGVSPEINAVSSILLLISIALTTLSLRLQRQPTSTKQ